ncbi:DUF397 domain-containing protein [Streptomyces sp. NPDC051567]|uniref:DUF397 domain-containing protein n=1 Tax=Streptomyces sp. NPDC051567 TaxID=3365660 RepID=UPI0037A14E3C
MMNQKLTNTRSETRLTWVKSSYSDGAGQNCVEVAVLAGCIGIRDSKDTSGPALLVPAEAWTAFVGMARS